MDYACAKFVDFIFSRFWFYRADKHTQNHKQTPLVATLTRKNECMYELVQCSCVCLL